MNSTIADRLREAASLLRKQGADFALVNAYLRAAATVRRWPEPLPRVFHDSGLDGLEKLPDVGPSIARAIGELVVRGRPARTLDRRGPEALLASVNGIGRCLAQRLHRELKIDTLEKLEDVAQDGRLARIAGFGRMRIAGVRGSLARIRAARRRSGMS